MSTYGRWIERRERILTLRDTSRRILRFDWGLEFLGRQGGGDPLSQVKAYARSALGDLNFYASSPPRNVRRSGDRLTFESPVESAYPVNNTVYARIFPGPDRGRAVIVVPQWNANESSHVGLCRLFARLGITALRLSLPYHERRLPLGEVRAEHMVSPNIGRTLQATRQAVLEVLQAAHWLRDEGYEHVGVMGTSIGSCVTFLAFVHDPLIGTGVFNHVSSSFAHVVWTGLATRYVRWGLEGYIARDDLEHCWAPISPWYFIPRLRESQRPHLLITARYDLTFVPELSQQVFLRYREHGIPFDRIELPCGHYTTARFPFICMDAWHICRYLHRHLGRRQ